MQLITQLIGLSLAIGYSYQELLCDNPLSVPFGCVFACTPFLFDCTSGDCVCHLPLAIELTCEDCEERCQWNAPPPGYRYLNLGCIEDPDEPEGCDCALVKIEI